jgi:hypothetical protein
LFSLHLSIITLGDHIRNPLGCGKPYL